MKRSIPKALVGWPAWLVAAAVIGIAGGGLAAGVANGSLAAAFASSPAGDFHYEPAYGFEAGGEIVMVFLVNSACNAHRTEGFPDAVDRAKVALAARAEEDGRQFRALGAALEWRTKDAGRFMDRFGEFDEVALGGNWLNAAAVRYVWRDPAGAPSVPQILVLHREIETTDHGIHVSDERVLHRIVGSEEIMEWVDAGVPLPRAEAGAPEL